MKTLVINWHKNSPAWNNIW